MFEERRDYLIAFLIGAVVGVGTTLLLGTERKKKSKRYRVARPAQRLRKRGRRLRKALRRD
jgi:hypothetical protein